ncbi:DUF262 domain-containing protein [Pararhizobium sp. BT-229]|uniref:GmrSD restriction endonuclease domain-containing protein n=1 Tax=Pararhizobium sp. BT-229 TaxID=2986923 RepID=UPI0021F7B8CD|nr:DUF262 domain-containing protein [Pararhizobium sp. BT-229]MCV9964892.1 DUF262 domain-containing protein [Pararhizobium sp. BT-229]
MSYKRRETPKQNKEMRTLSLFDLLADIKRSEVQLANLQREWCWPIENILALVESIIENQLFGNPVFYETAGRPKIAYRTLEGVDPDPSGLVPSYLILDGQQRLTAAYQALASERPIKIVKKTGGRAHYCRLFIDVIKVVRADIPVLESIIVVATDHTGRPLNRNGPDYDSLEYQYRHGVFPLNKISEFPAWQRGAQEFWTQNFTDDNRALVLTSMSDFGEVVYQAFRSCTIFVNIMKHTVTLAEIAKYYEKSNSIALRLTSFHLLIARYFPSGYDLAKDWAAFKERMKKDTHGLLSTITDKQMMHANMVVSNLRDGHSFKDILDLPLENYQATKSAVVDGFIEASRLLIELCVYKNRLLPQTILVTGVAAIFAVLGQRSKDVTTRRKVSRWLHCCMIGAVHRKNGGTGVAAELPDLLDWINGGRAPASVRDFVISKGAIASTKSGPLLDYLMAANLRARARDFGTDNEMTVQLLLDGKFDIHHVVPKAYCVKEGIPEEKYDSVLNKTILSTKTNGIISGNAPSSYLVNLEQRFGTSAAEVDATIASHGFDPALLRADDFEGSMDARLDYYCKIIEAETGGLVVEAIAEDEVDSSQFGDAIDAPEGTQFIAAARGAVAYMKRDGDQFFVLKGSIASSDCQPSTDTCYLQRREELIDNGVFVQMTDDRWCLEQDIDVASPSAAFSIFAGQKPNGKGWKDIDGTQVNPLTAKAA